MRLDRVGEIEEAAGVYAETKIEEVAERKLRFDKPELAQKWDKIQRRQRQALIPTIESTQSLDLGRSLTLSLEQQTKNDRSPPSIGCYSAFGSLSGRAGDKSHNCLYEPCPLLRQKRNVTLF